MTNPTVAEYVVKRLSDLGVDKVFGVPGDYSFPIDDAIEVCPTLEWIACANELNAAYAADGYARLKGAAILSTTYGVGELSAINGVMGSKAHRLPVFDREPYLGQDQIDRRVARWRHRFPGARPPLHPSCEECRTRANRVWVT